MGKTSSEAKNRYNKKAYDRISLTVKKGTRERIAAYAEKLDLSVNGYINMLIEKDMQQDDKA